MLLIIIGISTICKRHVFHFHGLPLLCLGIFFIIPKVAEVFPSTFSCIDRVNFIAVYWPLLLIVGGIILILHIPVSNNWRLRRHYSRYNKRFGNGYGHGHGCFWGNNDFRRKENCSQEENFSKTSVFSNGRYVVDTEFTGGELQAIFGGIEFDLRKAHLPEGETSINIEVVFGGVSLFVPDNWLIEVKIESVLGGIDDARRIVETVDVSRKLIIKGSAVFGGVEIRN
jgi:predicted membrane protein